MSTSLTYEDGDHPMQDAEPAMATLAVPGANGTATTTTTSTSDNVSPNGEEGGSSASDEEATAAPDPSSTAIACHRLLPSGVCYDDRMKMHMNADFSPNPPHPEDPRRIHAIFQAFIAAGLVYTGPQRELPRIIKETPTRYMWRIGAREATPAEVREAHSADHLKEVQDWDTLSTQQLRELSAEKDSGRDSLYVGALSHMAGLLAAGGAIETCKNVVEGHVKNAFAVIRPPGHHAEWNKPMGFCVFNNVPIAAKVCMKDYPLQCRKVLIVDWDVHHGNGIQDIFYRDPNVLYISIHVYQDGRFYPGRDETNPMHPDGGPEHCGSAAGLGRNVNIPWHDQGMGDAEYMAAFQKIVMPIASEFDPDLVIISAGFDAADGDELGGCFVSPACYAHMTHMLMSLANGKLAVCLEGGYNLAAISTSAVAVAKTLMGEPPPRLSVPPIDADAARVLQKVQAYQAHHWQCMRPGIVDVPNTEALEVSRLGDALRMAQYQDLATRHKMLPLYVQRQGINTTFANQVLVTPGLMKARRVLIVLHDPPSTYGQPDPRDQRLEADNVLVVDGTKQYIDWAVENGFGVMDINVPGHANDDEPVDPTRPRLKESELSEHLEKLTDYLWDNYISLYEAEDIFVLGIGFAHLGIRTLLVRRDCKDRLAGVVAFVSGTLRPVKSATDETLSKWFKDNSRIYVSSSHRVWSIPDLKKKVLKKRFGDVVESPAAGLDRMLGEHAAEVRAWMMERCDSSSGETTEDEDGMDGA